MAITAPHQAIMDTKGGTMGQQRIAFHFAKTDASVLLASFHGLACGADY